MCPMHSETKNTEMLEFGAEQGLLEGHASKEHRELMLKNLKLRIL